ncbi:MAG: hypothetical protein OXD43_03605 [Bacteroidetes bacterium]|nr:hypothetical protein [Bacteroidota bacterium]
MESPVYPYKLTALTPWAWHGLAVPSGTSTLNDIVTDTAMAFATAIALGMSYRSPCLPSSPDYRGHLSVLPFKTSLFIGNRNNRLNRPIARRLNLDAECGLPKRVHDARTSGNIKDYYHIQEVHAGAEFFGSFLHADPLCIAAETYGGQVDHLVVRLGLGRNGVGLLERTRRSEVVQLNLHTAWLFDPNIDLEAGPYRLHNIQPSRPITCEKALAVTARWV